MTSRITAIGTSPTYETAAQFNDAAGGWVHYFDITSSQGSITGAVDLTGMTTGAWVMPTRRYKFCFDMPVQNSNANETCLISLLQDGVSIKRWDFPTSPFAGAGIQVAGSYHQGFGTPGTHTFKLQIARSGTSSGTLTMNASAVSTGQFWIEDLGPV